MTSSASTRRLRGTGQTLAEVDTLSWEVVARFLVTLPAAPAVLVCDDASDRFHADTRELPLGAVASAEPGPSEGLDRLEQHQWLLNHVARLPEPYRSTIIVRYLEGRSIERLVERNGQTAAAVRKQ